MRTSGTLRLVAIGLGLVALVLVGIAAVAEPGAPRAVLLLAGGSAAVTVAAMLLAGRRG